MVFTASPALLTDAQTTSFSRDGYLILRNVLSPTAQQDLIQWTSDVKAWPNLAGQHMPYLEIDAKGRKVVSRVENFANYHEGFSGLLRGSQIVGILEELAGEEMHLFKEKINYKLAHAGGFDAHIDAVAYTAVGAKQHLTILLAVEEATMSNGCLEVVPGSQSARIPLGEDRCITPEWVEAHEWIPVELKTGEFLVFGSHLAHRSGPNHSEFGRAAIYATYNAESDGGDIHDAYYADRRIKWPATFERVKGESYAEGAVQYGFGSPMLTMQGQDV